MTIRSKTSLALAIALATSGLSMARADTAPQPTHATVRHAAHDFARAKALAPVQILAPARAEHAPETDELSRDADDCNYGCIDNGR